MSQTLILCARVESVTRADKKRGECVLFVYLTLRKWGVRHRR